MENLPELHIVSNEGKEMGVSKANVSLYWISSRGIEGGRRLLKM